MEAGNEVFIIGGGSSLIGFPFNQLKDKNTIAGNLLNGILLEHFAGSHSHSVSERSSPVDDTGREVRVYAVVAYSVMVNGRS